MKVCAPDFEDVGKIVHLTLKKTNAIFLSKFSLEFQPSSNFKILEGYSETLIKLVKLVSMPHSNT